ncbi:MAG: outer membrane protein transport protein [Leptospiraceae bacterium]|nr:outer membrane protein transport protein [Leptospiraceae bacterium]MCP5512982.1 outer membrane protein transport protein [Leptospiraceae bacterium]
MKVLRLVSLHLIMGVIVPISLSAGEFGDIYGAHPAAAAMGGAVVSTVNDSSSVYYNVAGLGKLSEGELIRARIEAKELEKQKALEEANLESSTTEEAQDPQKKPGGYKKLWEDVKKNSFTYIPAKRTTTTPHELTFQYNFARPELNTSAPSNQDLVRVRDDYGGLGLTINLNSIYDLKRNIKFGLNVLLPGTGNLLTINDVNPTVHRYLQRGVSNQKPTIMGGLGIELWKDRLFAGIGFTGSISGKGAILLKDVPVSRDRVIPNQQVILETKPFANPLFGLNFQYGKFSAGISYRREMALSVDSLPARAQTTLLGIQLDFDVAMYDLFSPRKWSYGMAYRPLEKILVSIQLDRELWSAFRQSRTKNSYSEKVYFNDINIMRLGTEYSWRDWLKFRAGIARRPRPTPTMYGQVNWMDFDSMGYTAGLSYVLLPGFLKDLKSPIILDFVAGYQKLHGEHVWKRIPTERNPSYSMGGRALHAGVSITMFF